MPPKADEVKYLVKAQDGFSALHKKANATVQKSADIAKKATLATAASVGVLTVSLGAMLHTTAKSGDELQKMSGRLDISSQALSELDFAAQLSGASIGDIERGVKKLAKTALDADRGLSTAARTFDDLGISVRDANGDLKDNETLFTETIDALNKVENSTKRTALAQEALGRSGTTLIPLITAGKDGLNDMREEARALGITFNQLEANQSAAFIDAELRITSAAIGMKNTLSKDLLPFVTTVMDTLADEFIDFRETGQLDEWAAETAEIVITSFSEMISFAANIPVAWNAAMVGVKTIAAGFIAAIQAITGPLQTLDETLQTTGVGASAFGDAFADDRKFEETKSSLSDVNKMLEETAIELLLSTEENEKSGEKWAEWGIKAEAAIERVRRKAVEGLKRGPSPEDADTTPIVTADGTGSTEEKLTQAAAEKVISLQQSKFQKLREMAIESDLSDREIAGFRATRELEAIEMNRLRLEEAGLLTAELRDQFRVAEEDTHLLHEQRLTQIASAEAAKRIELEKQVQALKFQTAVTGFDNILALTGAKSKQTFRAVQILNAAVAVNDSKAAILGAYKHGATIGGPLVGAGFAALALAAVTPLVTAIGGGGISGAGGGTPSGGGAPATRTSTAPTPTLVATGTQEQLQPQQTIHLSVRHEGISITDLDNQIEGIVDAIGRAGKDRSIKIIKEAIAV